MIHAGSIGVRTAQHRDIRIQYGFEGLKLFYYYMYFVTCFWLLRWSWADT